MKTCKTCRWWTRENGRCEFVETIQADVPATRFVVEADAADDTGLTTMLVTGPNFGCIHHADYVVLGNGK